jgi:predicted Zn-dependent peptidase
MFQGSRHVGEDMFLRYVERAGASDRGATTTADRTTYEETVPSNQLELALWLESDRMAWMLDHLDASVLAAQRDAVKTERRERTDNAPYGLVGSLLREALYPAEHPYHRALGAPAQGEAIALDDVRGFFRTYYVPNDATLVLAGDFDPALAKALVAQYFGPIPRGADASLARPAPVSIPGEKRLDVAANVELARVAVAWHAPPAFAPGHAELALLTSLLARGRASRLYEHLVYDRQMAESVSAKLTEGQLGSVFEIVATLRRGKTAEEALAVIDQVLDDLRSQPPAFTEMERAAAYTVADATFPLDRASGRAAALARAAQLAGDPAMFSRLLERVQRAQPADVTAAAATWLPRDRRVVALVHADPGAPRAGQLVGSR